MINTQELAQQFHVASMALGPINTNCHILYLPDVAAPSKAVIIDAPLQSLERIKSFLKEQNLVLQALLLTHGHWDHMGGAEALRQQLNCGTWGGSQDLPFFREPEIMRAFAGDVALLPATIDHVLDLDFIAGKTRVNIELPGWPQLEIEALAMPGHSPGGIAYYFPQAACVMTGDQLFRSSVGSSDFPGGDFSLLRASIQKLLYQLAPTTQIFAGHGPCSSIGDEMHDNPFVRAS